MRSGDIRDNRFLIVDNYPFLRDIMRRTLLSLGAAHVDTVASASPAIGRCRSNHYDMVLADYDLGSGKNGQQLLEELRNEKLLRNTSGFVVVTSETARDVVLATLEHQPDDYLAKPYPQHLLERRIRRLLRFKSRLHPVFEAIDQGDYTAAIDKAREYLAQDTEFRGSTLRILGQLYLACGDLERAEAIYRAEREGTESDWARMGLARVLLERQQYSEAETLFLGLIQTNYLYVEAYEYLARLYLAADAPEKAEAIMGKAVLVSPLSLRRQRLFAHLCERNGHLEAAAGAWRDVIRIARNSRHEGPESHIGLSRVLTDFCEIHDCYSDERFGGDALRQLELMRARYRPWGDSQLQSLLIEGRIHFGRGDSTRARSCLREASLMIDEGGSHLLPGSLLEYAKSLHKAGDTDQCEAVLADLARRPDVDSDVLALADKVLDEPVSQQGKQRIVTLNREGIQHFRKADYHAAREAFALAQARFPRNVELNLNLMQTLLKLIGNSSDEREGESWLTEAERCQLLIGQLPPEHPKSEHFRRLGREIAELQTKLRA